jgi:hypothetical protein
MTEEPFSLEVYQKHIDKNATLLDYYSYKVALLKEKYENIHWPVKLWEAESILILLQARAAKINKIRRVRQ